MHEYGLDESAQIDNLEDLSSDDNGLILTKGQDDVICPRDGTLGAAYVDCVEGEDSVEQSFLVLGVYHWNDCRYPHRLLHYIEPQPETRLYLDMCIL